MVGSGRTMKKTWNCGVGRVSPARRSWLLYRNPRLFIGLAFSLSLYRGLEGIYAVQPWGNATKRRTCRAWLPVMGGSGRRDFELVDDDGLAVDEDGSVYEVVKVYRRRAKASEGVREPPDRPTRVPPPSPPYPPYPPMPPYPPYVIVTSGGCPFGPQGPGYGGASERGLGYPAGAAAGSWGAGPPATAVAQVASPPVQSSPVRPVPLAGELPPPGRSGGGPTTALLDLADRALAIGPLMTTAAAQAQPGSSLPR